MAQAIPGLSPANLFNIGAAGAGAASAAFVATMIPVANPTTRNLLVAVGGAIVASMARGPFRMFGIGIGAVAVADLIRTNLLMRA